MLQMCDLVKKVMKETLIVYIFYIEMVFKKVFKESLIFLFGINLM